MGRLGIWLRNLALLAVLATFAFLFGQPRGGDGRGHGRNIVAEVNGEEVPRDVFEFFREQNQETFRQFSQQGIDPERLATLIDDQTRSSLVRRYLMSQEADSLGLSVSDAALKEDFQSNPGFLVDGKFDREIAERYVNRTGLGPREYAAQHRRDMLIRNFSRYVASPVRVSDGEVRDEILRHGHEAHAARRDRQQGGDAGARFCDSRGSEGAARERARARARCVPDAHRGLHEGGADPRAPHAVHRRRRRSAGDQGARARRGGRELRGGGQGGLRRRGDALRRRRSRLVSRAGA